MGSQDGKSAPPNGVTRSANQSKSQASRPGSMVLVMVGIFWPESRHHGKVQSPIGQPLDSAIPAYRDRHKAGLHEATATVVIVRIDAQPDDQTKNAKKPRKQDEFAHGVRTDPPNLAGIWGSGVPMAMAVAAGFPPGGGGAVLRRGEPGPAAHRPAQGPGPAGTTRGRSAA